MFAALYIPDFPVEAVIRAAPELRERAVAVIEGTPPLETVCALNEAARALGIEAGMTRLQAQSFGPELEVRKRSLAQEDAAHAALLDCAQAFSPRVEDTAADTVIADLAGLEQLFGAPAKIARDLAKRASDLGLEAHAAVASNPDAAMHAARGFAGVTVIAPGKEAERLGTLSVEILAPSPEMLDTLERWGVRNLRALGALPEVAVTERLGQDGLRLQRLARGATERDLVPCEPALRFEETMELEYPVELLEPLAFVLGRLLEQLCARLNARALATNELRVALSLPPSAISEDVSSFAFQVSREEEQRETRNVKRETLFLRTLKLPVPMLDSNVFLKLLQLDLKAHPPGAPIVKVALSAEPVRPRYAQSGLFVPQAPEPERLELTLARIAGVVGKGNLGSAELLDTHRPDAFRMMRFALPTSVAHGQSSPKTTKPGQVLALRVFRPPLQITVDIRGERPARIRSEKIHGEVVSAAGPWRISGEWWKNKTHHRDSGRTEKNSSWAREEWDVAVMSLMKMDVVALYRIYRDEQGTWFVHGEYD